MRPENKRLPNTPNNKCLFEQKEFISEESHVRSGVDSGYVIEDIAIVNRVSGLSHKRILLSFVLELEPISREMCVNATHDFE